ncbi:MAG: response regulator [Gammaproteobacteria bacterium]|nr:response regulator [Gammaproteobacteria bacterium]
MHSATERALRAGQDQLQAVLQTLPDPVWLKDPEGRFLYCNRWLEAVFAAPEAEIIGKTDYDFVDQETADAFRANDQAALAAGEAWANLDVSKIESDKIELEQVPFQLTQVLDNLATLMSANAEDKALDLAIVPPRCSAWTLRGDPLRLGQILINLTNNAIKFTEAGSVEVRIEPLAMSPLQVRLRFSVHDNGIGIDPVTQARLFQPFKQADASTTRHFGGSGLGLVICQRLVELMGGRMGLASTPRASSTFWFELAFEVVKRGPVDERLALGLKVLAVEGAAVTREGMVATIHALGWTAAAVQTAAEAARKLRQSPALQGPDAVVLLDGQLPNQDGVTTADAIRAALPAARRPLLFLVTACPVEQVQAQAGAAALDGVLAKPLSPSPLYDAVVRARGRRLGQAGEPAAAPRQQQRLPGARLLVVDDSEINREVAQRILANEGAAVTLAGDGREAVDWLLLHPGAVDLVLMDVQMPVMDGYDATRSIRCSAALAALPVVALTAGAMPAQAERAQAAGMDAFVSKPFARRGRTTCSRRGGRPGGAGHRH